jgi:sulfatase modifying factor 1
VTVSSFKIDKYEVSNDDYLKFVSSTNYKTESEMFGWSFVFESAVPIRIKKRITQAVLGAEWWLPVNGSYWREPEGPGTDVFKTSRGNYPVVQISWTDAVEFCKWKGVRLPTEAEWEYAAKGKDSNNTHLFPWGNKLTPKSKFRANIFQGKFPETNTKDDGYEYLAPVDAFGPQNDYGLYNMVGNAWEWVEDWFRLNHNTEHVINPKGPPIGRDKVTKGGSFLCHRSFCYRYRNNARYATTPDSATLNSGFRCAASINDNDIDGSETQDEE